MGDEIIIHNKTPNPLRILLIPGEYPPPKWGKLHYPHQNNQSTENNGGNKNKVLGLIIIFVKNVDLFFYKAGWSLLFHHSVRPHPDYLPVMWYKGMNNISIKQTYY
jgi:hypothetical protein